jgi:hypothetical protein
MSTTDLAKCSTSAALSWSTPTRPRKHLAGTPNTNFAASTPRRRSTQLNTTSPALTATPRPRPTGSSSPHHPSPWSPIRSVNETPDDEIDDEDDLAPSMYADDDVAATIANPTAGEPLEDAADDLNTVPRLTAINDLA